MCYHCQFNLFGSVAFHSLRASRWRRRCLQHRTVYGVLNACNFLCDLVPKTCLSKGTGSAFYFGAVADQFACIVEKLEKRILRYAMLYYTILYYELLCYDMLCSALHCTTLHWTLLYSALLYATLRYATLLYSTTVLCYTTLYLCTCTEEKLGEIAQAFSSIYPITYMTKTTLQVLK